MRRMKLPVLIAFYLAFAGTLGAVVATRHDVVPVHVMNTDGYMKIRFMERCDVENWPEVIEESNRGEEEAHAKLDDRVSDVDWIAKRRRGDKHVPRSVRFRGGVYTGRR
jgi:hypothetical protein